MLHMFDGTEVGAWNLALATGREIAYAIYEELAIVRQSLSKEDADLFYKALSKFDDYKIKDDKSDEPNLSL